MSSYVDSTVLKGERLVITKEDLARRIEAARSRAGLSQGQLAKSVGVTQSAISRIESGERSVDSLELAAIARALGVSVLDLLEEHPLPDVLSFAGRIDVGHQTGALEQARQRIVDLLRFDALLNELGLPPEVLGQMPSLQPPQGPAKNQGQSLAEKLRKQLGLRDRPIPDLYELMERELGVDIALEPTPEGLAGLCAHSDGVAIALVDSSSSYGRQRFTVAHELCHCLVGDAEPVWIDEQLFGTSTREVRANAFAAHFLMPTLGITSAIKSRKIDGQVLTELQHAFGVSLDALLWHLVNLGQISASQRRQFLQIGPKALAFRHGYVAEWRSVETQRDAVRPPSRLVRRALEAYSKGLIGIDRLAELFRVRDVEAFRRELEDAGISRDAWIADTAPA